MIYDFVLYSKPEQHEADLTRVKQAGVQVVDTYNEGNSILVRAVFPKGTLRRFQNSFPTGWFRRVSQ